MTREPDYTLIGLKCGLEVHYQLDTRTKLFCNCPVGLRNDPPDAEIIRHMRPTLSELGEYDGTALMEFKTRKEVHYQLHYDTVCTYEMDDTPPFLLNQEALEIALEIALLLNCQIADEIHVSRKQYLDGSIPTGFQRTIAVGVDGRIPFRGRDIRVLQLCLEEDACREVSDNGHVITLRTDRLSTPLVEVITAPDMHDPEEAAAVDREIGRILRATGRVRRGIGTVRQDVNVSIRGGTRVEIKGVPRTGMIEPLVGQESARQHALLFLRHQLKVRGISRKTLKTESVLCTELFHRTEVKPIAAALSRGGSVGAVKLGGFAGLLRYPLGTSRLFVDELKGRVRVIACLDEPPILFHSDVSPEEASFGECPSDGEWQAVKERMGARHTDALVLVWGSPRDVLTALDEIADRAAEATEGVPQETRQVLKGGETDFERILPGPDRMYPDTDSAPIPISRDMLERIRSGLPTTPGQWRDRHEKLLGRELVNQLIDRDVIEDFDLVYRKTNAAPTLVARFVLEFRREIQRREGRHFPPGRTYFVQEELEAVIRIFIAFRNGEICRDLIKDLFTDVLEGGDLEKRMEERNVSSKKEIERAVAAVLGEAAAGGYRNRAHERAGNGFTDKELSHLIGRVKKRVHGSGDGKIIRALLEAQGVKHGT